MDIIKNPQENLELQKKESINLKIGQLRFSKEQKEERNEEKLSV